LVIAHWQLAIKQRMVVAEGSEPPAPAQALVVELRVALTPSAIEQGPLARALTESLAIREVSTRETMPPRNHLAAKVVAFPQLYVAIHARLCS
jgi:hypothetical protein